MGGEYIIALETPRESYTDCPRRVYILIIIIMRDASSIDFKLKTGASESNFGVGRYFSVFYSKPPNPRRNYWD